MKSSLTLAIALGIATTILSSCTKDIDYKGPDSQPMFVMNCIVQDGETVRVNISRSVFFLDSFKSRYNPDGMTTVNVEINGENRLATWNEDDNVFTDSRIVHAGDIVHITASHPDYNSISATDTVPLPSNCYFTHSKKLYSTKKSPYDIFSSDDDSSFDDSGVDSIWVVDIDIDDRENIPDFYYLSIMPTITFVTDYYEGGPLDTVVVPIHYRIPSKTRILLGENDDATSFFEEYDEENGISYGVSRFIFPDQHIKDGSLLSFEILMEKPDTISGLLYYDYSQYDGEYDNEENQHNYNGIVTAGHIHGDIVYTLNVSLHTLSGAYYYYHKSVEDFAHSDVTLMSEPVTVISNVNGGVGILGAYSSRQIALTTRSPF